jgi:lipoate-protein ligase A
MRFLDLTLPSPAENLACDDALLQACTDRDDGEILRVWESPIPFVVVGYGNPTAQEVDLEACRRHGLPVLRRSSGGGSVVQGPGCLNYTLILRIPTGYGHPLRSIGGTHAYVTRQHTEAMRHLLGPAVEAQGSSDLALGTRKFSGNAQRRGKSHLLVHGTLLRTFKLPLIEAALKVPADQPDYRAHRAHRDFLTNTGLSRADIIDRLRAIWSADCHLSTPPWHAIDHFAVTRYQTNAWMVQP